MRSYCRQKAMLDYHAHIAALRLLKQGPTALVTSDGPPHPALLRAVLDHLFEHTGASDVELSLLEQASGLWQSAGKLMSAVAGIRSDLESLVLDPSPILTVSLNQLRASLSFGAPSAPSLPPAVDQVLTAALTDTYGAAGPGP